MLTIYVCPSCPMVTEFVYGGTVPTCAGSLAMDSAHGPTPMVPVGVFREQDVRPLWDLAYAVAWTGGGRTPRAAREVVDAFPAPEDW